MTVTSAWTAVAFPEHLIWSTLVAHPQASIADALADYADSVAASASSSAACLPAMQRLQGWSLDVRCVAIIARIPSLTELLRPYQCRVLTTWDLSPLFTADLQPLLPHLHTLEFAYGYPTHHLLDKMMAVLTSSSIAFLSAYSAQLRELKLVVYTSASACRLMEAVPECSQLQRLQVFGCILRYDQLLPEGSVDVEQLDEAVARLPPLSRLQQLPCLDSVSLSVH